MSDVLSIVGGTYYEICIDPQDKILSGSGLRAASALSGSGFKISLHSCIGSQDLEYAKIICNSFEIEPHYTLINNTITFEYCHPLAIPDSYPHKEGEKILQLRCSAKHILYYGLAESSYEVHADYVVYDPQNGQSFESTGSTSNHLALVLNRKEAWQLAGMTQSDNLVSIGYKLMNTQGAEVIVIKNGSQGALVIEENKTTKIPIFTTTSVWPIGSGDIFSAAFAWKWMMCKVPPAEAALYASCCTAQYCQTRLLPITGILNQYSPIFKEECNKIYLAGPFFTTSERYLITECHKTLELFGNEVFSPYHDVGLIDLQHLEKEAEKIVSQDLDAIRQCDVLFAIIDGLDPGTLFEIGFATALNKKVIVLAENVTQADMLMLIGTGCKITSDFSTAIYTASWI